LTQKYNKNFKLFRLLNKLLNTKDYEKSKI